MALDTKLSVEQQKLLAQYRKNLSKSEQKAFDELSENQQISLMSKEMAVSSPLNKSQVISIFNGQIVDSQDGAGLSVESNSNSNKVQEQSVVNTKTSTKAKIVDVDGEEVEEQTTKNEDGTTTKTIYSKDGKEKSVTEYDQSGKMTKKTQNRPDGTKSVTEYNSDGKTAKSAVYDEAGKLLCTAEEEVDEKGRATKGTATYPDGKKQAFSNEYLENGDMVQTQYREDGTTPKTKVKADKNNRIKETIDYNKDGTSTQTVYKADGKTVDKAVSYDKNGKELLSYKTQYGDTLYEIVKAKYGVTDHNAVMIIVKQIRELNKIPSGSSNIPKDLKLPSEIDINGKNYKLDTSKEVDKSSFVDGEKKAKAEKKAAEETKKQEETKQKQEKATKEGESIANALKSDMDGVGTSDTFSSNINKINKDNVMETLAAYKKISPSESLIQTISREWEVGGLSVQERVDAINHIMDALVAKAKEVGVSEDDLFKAQNEFSTAIRTQVRSIGRMDMSEAEKAVDFLHGAILAKQVGKNQNIDSKNARNIFVKNASDENTTAQKAYADARKEEGWAAKTGDTVLGWFGCTTKDDMDKKLGKYSNDIKRLQEASGDEKKFRQVYYEVFGIEFDANKVAAYEAEKNNIQDAEVYSNAINVVNDVLSTSQSKDYSTICAELKQKLNYDDKTINAIVDAYLKKNKINNATNKDKKEMLIQFMNDTKTQCSKEYQRVTQGKSLDQMQEDLDLIRKSAFGTKDIVKDVIKYNENQLYTEMAVRGAAEVVGTIAVCWIPGVGEAACAKTAASFAKFGYEASRLARMASTMERGFQIVKTASEASKITRGVTAVVGTGVATAAVNASDGRTAKETIKKTIMNMSFAGVGATAAEIAPLLIKAFGFTNKVATEVAEQIINAVGAAGITKLSGGDYTSTDGIIDMITGIVLARLTGKMVEGAEHDQPHASEKHSEVSGNEKSHENHNSGELAEANNTDKNNNVETPNSTAPKNEENSNATSQAIPNMNQKTLEDLLGKEQISSLKSSGIDVNNPKIREALSNLKQGEKITIGTEASDGSHNYWTYENRNGKIVEIAAGGGNTGKLPEGCIIVERKNVNNQGSYDKAKTDSKQNSEQSYQSQGAEQSRKQEESRKTKQTDSANQSDSAENANKNSEAKQSQDASAQKTLSESEFSDLQSKAKDLENEINKLKSHSGLSAEKMEEYRKVLELDPNTPITKDTLKEAKRKLSQKYHPDKEGGSTEKMQEINDAIDKLEKNLKKGTVDPAIIQQKESELAQLKQQIEDARQIKLKDVSEKISDRISNLKDGQDFTFGRNSSYAFESSENAMSNSRNQVKISNVNGEIFIQNVGKNPITINGVEIKANDGFKLDSGMNKVTMPDGSTVELNIPKSKVEPSVSSQANETSQAVEQTEEESKPGFLKRLFGKKKKVEENANVSESAAASKSEPTYSRPELDKYKLDPKKKYGKMTHEEFYNKNAELFEGNHTNGVWSFYTPADQSKGAWKMHMYAVSEEEWQKMADVIIPYLKEHDVDWKTFSKYNNASCLNGSMQQGKAFTIYPKNNADFEQIAKDLDYIIKKNGLQKADTNITGDRKLGDSGRIFYRYEYNTGDAKNLILDVSKKGDRAKYDNLYDSNRGEGKYLADDMTTADDPFYDFNPADPNSKPSATSQANGEKQNKRVAQDISSDGNLEKGNVYRLGDKSKLVLANKISIDLNDPRIKWVIDNMKDGDSITIGREGTIRIKDESNTVSRIHFVIYKRNGKLYIEDVSSNGTRVAA